MCYKFDSMETIFNANIIHRTHRTKVHDDGNPSFFVKFQRNDSIRKSLINKVFWQKSFKICTLKNPFLIIKDLLILGLPTLRMYIVTKKFYQNWTLIPHEKRLQYSGEVRTRKTPASFEGEEKGRFLTG